MNNPPVVVAIALGSNQGDRYGHLAFAIDRLTHTFGPLAQSSIHDTEPVGVSHPQPNFLNMAVLAQTTLSAMDVLERLLEIERQAGRVRPYPNAPRTLDLDLILYGDAIVTQPTLTVPHPRFRERRFVLEPLCEIGPDLRDPVTRRSLRQLLDQLGASTD